MSNGKITNCHLTPRDVDRARELLGECAACIAAKAAAPKAHSSLTEPATKVGERVHVDVVFTKGKDSKLKRIMLSVDEFSGYLVGKEMLSLTKADVHKAFDDLMSFYETRAQSPIGTLVTDRERSFQALNQGHKLPLKLVASGRHARVAERQIRHVKNMMRAVIYKLPYKLPGSLYGRLLFHCANLTNYTVRSNHFNVPSQSIRKALHGVRP
jgi:hypothetical protein